MSAHRLSEAPAALWLRYAAGPLLWFLVAATLFEVARLDIAIAEALFFDSARGEWRGAHHWLVEDVIHTGGRWAVRGVVAVALAVWAASFFSRPVRGLRRPLGYFIIAVVLTVGFVGLLKIATNVDCPWDLQRFGGRFPYVELFSARPPELPRARCFPAAHASSGYAFMALYFVARERSRTLALLGLIAGLLLGLIFGLAQQARGAHFASHDLWSAFLAWIIPLTLYAFAFRGRVHVRAD